MKRQDTDNSKSLKQEIDVAEEEVSQLDKKLKDNDALIQKLKDDIWKERDATVKADDQCMKVNISTVEDKLYYAKDRKAAYESELSRLDRKALSLKEIFDRLSQQRKDQEKEYSLSDDEKKTKALEDKIKKTEELIRTNLGILSLHSSSTTFRYIFAIFQSNDN